MLITTKDRRPRTPVAVIICWSMPTTTMVASNGSSRFIVSLDSSRILIFLGLTRSATKAAIANSRGNPSIGVEKGQTREATTNPKKTRKGKSTLHQLIPAGTSGISCKTSFRSIFLSLLHPRKRTVKVPRRRTGIPRGSSKPT